jgi:hypothetical protein
MPHNSLDLLPAQWRDKLLLLLPLLLPAASFYDDRV